MEGYKVMHPRLEVPQEAVDDWVRFTSLPSDAAGDTSRQVLLSEIHRLPPAPDSSGFAEGYPKSGIIRHAREMLDHMLLQGRELKISYIDGDRTISDIGGWVLASGPQLRFVQHRESRHNFVEFAVTLEAT